jgi:squalene-hopene/tetraprenyl-beta-curcumene cyclase
MHAKVLVIAAASTLLAAGFLTACFRNVGADPSVGPGADAKAPGPWNPKAAAAYLDHRADWWMGWQPAARDHGTFCVSCHTALPYALVRSALRERPHDAPSDSERRLLDNVTKRVRLWKEVGPYYSDRADKAVESRGTEAVLNALILAHHDAQTGRPSEETRVALDNMWALQQTTGDRAGAWPWLQFGLSPWEDSDAQYYGAALAALAVGTAPENYRSTAAIEEHLKLLRTYLVREYPKQPLSNRLVLAWVSTKLSGLLERERQQSLVHDVLGQQQSDGGWSLSSLAASSAGSSRLRSYVRSWIRNDRMAAEITSDGYATALVALVLLETSTPRDNVQLQRGLAWLERNQNKADGSWPATSLNTRRDPSSDVGRFMSDAATAYAVLALTEANR